MNTRHNIIILYTLIIVFVFRAGFAAEIDSVTTRDLELENSLALINEIFNQRLQEGIKKANDRQSDIDDLEEGSFCDEKILYTELRKAIFQSYTASWGLKGYGLDKQLRSLLDQKSYSLSLNDSIYRDISYLEGFSLKMKKLSDVVNINGHLVGLDKIGHFFAQGWQYFELTEYKVDNIDTALKWGKEQEAGKFGYTTTGIFSFSDLVANLNGWRFWNKVLLKENDPLRGWIATLFDRPYISCETQIISSIKHRKRVKAWVSNTRFDLADFVDGAWDEGNNCNSYANADIEKKITARIHSVNPDFTCPCTVEECVAARKKYGAYAKHVLHPQCLSVPND